MTRKFTLSDGKGLSAQNTGFSSYLKQTFLLLFLLFLSGYWMESMAAFQCSNGTPYKEYGAYAIDFSGGVSVDIPDRTIGYPDGLYAKIDQSENITFEAYDIVLPGDTIYLWATSDNNSNPTNVNVLFSNDGSSFTGSTSVTVPGNGQNLVKIPVVVNHASGARFFRIVGQGPEKLRLDALQYTKWNCAVICDDMTISYQSGTAVSVVAENSVGGEGEAIDWPDNKKAEFDNTSDYLVLDLGQVLPRGAFIQLFMAHDKNEDDPAVFEVRSSLTTSNFTAPSIYFTEVETDAYRQELYEITAVNGARYIRIAMLQAPQKGFLDAIVFEYASFINGRNTINGNLFNDVNVNQVMDSGETGISGVTVELYHDANANNIIDVTDQLLQTVLTQSGGYYEFELTDYTDDYIIGLDHLTLPSTTVMTTDNVEFAAFTARNQYDCENNFGYRNCGAACPVTAYDDWVLFTPNSPVQIDVTGNDRGIINMIATAVASNFNTLLEPSNGTVSINSMGQVTYTPNFGFTGTDQFEYRICSSTTPVNCDIGLVTVQVCPGTVSSNFLGGVVYFESMPDDGNYDSSEDVVGGVPVDLYFDNNCNGVLDSGEPLMESSVTDANGFYSFETNGGCYITTLNLSDPSSAYAASQNDEASIILFSYGNCVPALNLGVVAKVDAVTDNLDLIINSVQVLDVLANDIGNLDIGSLSTTGLTQPSHGTVTVNPNGTITYTPDWGYNGTDVFEYSICSIDDSLVCDQGIVNLNIDCYAPPGQNIIYGFLFEDINMNRAFDGLENWTFPEQLDVELIIDANNNGEVDAGENPFMTTTTDQYGSYQFILNNNPGNYIVRIDETNAPFNAVLATEATYQVGFFTTGQANCAGQFGFAMCGGYCPPVAVNDSVIAPQGQSVFVNVLNNDYDFNNNIDPLSFTIIQQPINGSLIANGGSGELVYAPSGDYLGVEVVSYVICDLTNPEPICDTASLTITITESYNDPCAEATREHTYYLPFPEQELRTALINSASTSCNRQITNIARSITAVKLPYPGVVITYDHWEDGYEANIENPSQSTTQVWGDEDASNGVAPGYPDDILPAGGNIILDNQLFYSPRNPAQIYFDGKDKLFTTGDIALSRISGDDNRIEIQAAKTDVYDINRFGTSFTVPFGESLGTEFTYTSLFVRAAYPNTVVSIDTDNDGVTDQSSTLNEGEVLFIDGGIQPGATVVSTLPVGVDLLFGGLDCFGTRNINILPAYFYDSKYYSPVPTRLASAPAAAYLHNSLGFPITINWTSKFNNGSINLAGKSTQRFVLNDNSAYSFENPGGQSFTAIEVIDSDSDGDNYDWAFTLIAESRLTNFASLAWGPGSLNGSGNYNPLWVTPVADATIYIKYDGNLTDTTSLISPCDIPYDLAVPLTELEYYRIFDNSDNDQGGIAVYTCDGTSIAAVYGEDPYANNSSTPTSTPAMDVGTTVQPMCLNQMILATNDRAVSPPNDFVVIDVAVNDYAFLATVDPTSVSMAGLLQPSNGFVVNNNDGTVVYTPNPGWFGIDTFEYVICSVEYPDLCDIATVIVTVTDCDANPDENLVNGYVFLEQLPDDGTYDDEDRLPGFLVHLIGDANCNGLYDGNELIIESVVTDASGAYSFNTINGEFVKDNFDDPLTIVGGNDGSVAWDNNWEEIGASNGFSSDPISIRTDISEGDRSLMISGANAGASRDVDFDGATNASVKFSFRRVGLDNDGESLQVRFNGNTIYVIDDGNGIGTNPYYTSVHLSIPFNIVNPDGLNTIQFIANGSVTGSDYYYIDDLEIIFNKSEICFVTVADVSDKNGAYTISDMDEQAVSFTTLGNCGNDLYLGVLANIIANDNASSGIVNQPQFIDILSNDIGQTDVSSLVITDQPNHGVVTINPDGTVIYIPDPGYEGDHESFDYEICSLEDPLVCDEAKVFITVSCVSLANTNVIGGSVFTDFNENEVLDAGEYLVDDIKIYVYEDTDANGILNGAEGNQPIDSALTAGNYAFYLEAPISPVYNINVPIVTSVEDGHEKNDGEPILDNGKLEWKDDKPYVGLRFRSINIPRNADIVSASITFTASDGRDDYTDFEISIQDDDDASAFTTMVSDISDRWNNNEKLDWNNVEEWIKEEEHETPDLSSLVQYAVNRPDWNPNDNMAFIIKWLTGERKAFAYDDDPSTAPVLNISYQINLYPVHYIVEMDTSTLPVYHYSTSPIQISESFTFDGQSNCNNNFGINLNGTYAINDFAETYSQFPVGGNVLSNDFDLEGDLNVFQHFLAQDGSNNPISSGVVLSGTNYDGTPVANAGTLTFDFTGAFTFTPDTSFTGEVKVPYLKCDDAAVQACATAILTINVRDYDNPLRIGNNSIYAIDDYNLSYGDPVTGNILLNDYDPQLDAILLQGFNYDTDGDGVADLAGSFNTNIIVGGITEEGLPTNNAGVINIAQDGNYVFTPSPLFDGQVILPYQICDDLMENQACDNADLIIDVLPSRGFGGNLPPVAGDDFSATLVNTPVTGNWIANDSEPDDDDVRLYGVGDKIDVNDPSTHDDFLRTETTLMGGTLSFYKDGSYIYTPPLDYTGPDQLEYFICDDVDVPLCDFATIHLLVVPIAIDYGDLPADFKKADNLIPLDKDDDGRPDDLGAYWLGDKVDAESASHYSTMADGDNLNGINDEDGLIFPQYVYENEEAIFKVIIGGVESDLNVNVGMWIDFDLDGQFDQFTVGSGSTGARMSGGRFAVPDTLSLSVQIPAFMSSPMVGIRIRAFSGSVDNTRYTSLMRSGEVEDYVWNIEAALLPVEMASFEARAVNNDYVLLEWATAAEINNDYFTVERSQDAINWEAIETVDGAGNSNQLLNYRTMDIDPYEGTSYYRIKQTDFDGTYSYTDVRSVDITEAPTSRFQDVKLVPNPVHVNQNLTIVGLDDAPELEAKIIAMDGKEVIQVRLYGQHTIDISRLGLSAGTYIISLTDGVNRHQDKFIVIE